MSLTPPKYEINKEDLMDITCLSDPHGYYPELPGGDLLILAGDLTARDESYERIEFLIWLADQNYRKKVWIAGNHDNSLVGMKFTPIRKMQPNIFAIQEQNSKA